MKIEKVTSLDARQLAALHTDLQNFQWASTTGATIIGFGTTVSPNAYLGTSSTHSPAALNVGAAQEPSRSQTFTPVTQTDTAYTA